MSRLQHPYLTEDNNSNEINGRAGHFIKDFGIASMETAIYQGIKDAILTKVNGWDLFWSALGRLSDGSMATTAHRDALYHALAAYCVEHR